MKLLSAAAFLALSSNLAAGFQSPLIGTKQFSQEFLDNFNILKYHGGNGPYSDRRSYGISRETPDSCTVDQVVMLMRHGERYPDTDTGKQIEKALNKVKNSIKDYSTGDFAFLKHWTYYVPNECAYAAETYSGPYAGLTDAYHRGAIYRELYGHLWNGHSILPIFSSGWQRVITTARHFGQGFLGYNYSTNAALNIVSEDPSQGANSLTPTCFNEDVDKESAYCSTFPEQMSQFKLAADRLNKQYPGLKLNTTDIYYLMSLATYELNARPYSPWIGVFNPDEWVAFGYTSDLTYYYCAGPGSPSMVKAGSVFLNATLTALNQGPSVNPLLLNFAHDTDITPLLATLGLLTPKNAHLPTDRVSFNNPWSVTDIVPMGAHIVFERLSCNETVISPADRYVRIVLNEAVLPMEDCQSGPGYSCSLRNFTDHYSKTMPNYNKGCVLPAKYPQYFDLWWNYNTTTVLNHPQGPIRCAETLTTT